MTAYSKLLNEFNNNPRDICTVPLTKKQPLWFYVFAANGSLWVNSAKHHVNSSTLKSYRKLDEKECAPMLDIYHRRQKGEPVSQEAAEATRNQVYWYGVFSELGL